jgi:hypothetical protein
MFNRFNLKETLENNTVLVTIIENVQCSLPAWTRLLIRRFIALTIQVLGSVANLI